MVRWINDHEELANLIEIRDRVQRTIDDALNVAALDESTPGVVFLKRNVETLNWAIERLENLRDFSLKA